MPKGLILKVLFLGTKNSQIQTSHEIILKQWEGQAHLGVYAIYSHFRRINSKYFDKTNLDGMSQLAWIVKDQSRVFLVALAFSVYHLKCDTNENISRSFFFFKPSLVHSPRVIRLAKAMDLGPTNLPVDQSLRYFQEWLNHLIFKFQRMHSSSPFSFHL